MRCFKMCLSGCLVMFLLALHAIAVEDVSASLIQMQGLLFDAVQMAQVFPDSKTFVDCVPIGDPQKIVDAYNNECTNKDFDLKAFVAKHFEKPPALDINKDKLKGLTMEQYINTLWDLLTRPPDKDVANSTLIPLPYAYVVPGGRFREIYYWDTYFTCEGLVASGRDDLVEDMIKNFAHMIEDIGHIPNGNRQYYVTRSQPPFFCSLLKVLERAKGADAAMVYLPDLEKEYAYWMNGADKVSADNPTHLKVVWMPNGAVLNRYHDEASTPREESYYEDVELCQQVNPADKATFYSHIRAGAESGWDFSSRWFRDQKTMKTIHTTEIIPVDLNSILYDMEVTLAAWNQKMGNKEKAATYAEAAEKRKQALLKYCWNPKEKFFFDYCWVDQKQTTTWSLAGVYPLFFGAADDAQAKSVAKHIHDKFLQAGGLVTTLSKGTGQQWDWPNAWAPLQWVAIKGLDRYGHKELADDIATRFIATAWSQFARDGVLIEKYDVVDTQAKAGGGEYKLQVGFGWTNGVLIRLLTSRMNQSASE